MLDDYNKIAAAMQNGRAVPEVESSEELLKGMLRVEALGFYYKSAYLLAGVRKDDE